MSEAVELTILDNSPIQVLEVAVSDQGPVGPAGADGQGLNYVGTVADEASLPDPYDGDANDAYTDDATGHAWKWAGSAWIDVGQFKGDAGSDGAAGADGTNGVDGAAGADGSDGADGATGPAGEDGSDANVTNTNVNTAITADPAATRTAAGLGSAATAAAGDFAAAAHTHAWGGITSTPTTLGGYGITDAASYDQDLNTSDDVEFSRLEVTGGDKTVSVISGNNNEVGFDTQYVYNFSFYGARVLQIYNTGIRPAYNNSKDSGNASYRWRTVYAVGLDVSGYTTLGESTVGTLTTASASDRQRIEVTDALSPVVGSAVASGGSTQCLVRSNGTDWIVLEIY